MTEVTIERAFSKWNSSCYSQCYRTPQTSLGLQLSLLEGRPSNPNQEGANYNVSKINKLQEENISKFGLLIMALCFFFFFFFFLFFVLFCFVLYFPFVVYCFVFSFWLFFFAFFNLFIFLVFVCLNYWMSLLCPNEV